MKLIRDVVKRVVDEEVLQVLECLLQPQLSECDITVVGKRARILSHDARDHRQILLLHHERLDRELIEIVQEQVADFSIFRQINFFLNQLFRFHCQGSRRRGNAVL